MKKKNNYRRLYKKNNTHLCKYVMSICTLHVGVLHMLKKSVDYSEKNSHITLYQKNYSLTFV